MSEARRQLAKWLEKSPNAPVRILDSLARVELERLEKAVADAPPEERAAATRALAERRALYDNFKKAEGIDTDPARERNRFAEDEKATFDPKGGEPVIVKTAPLDSPATSKNENIQLENGTKLANGRYEIRRRLGGGGMGVVYAAYDRSRKEEVALKVIKSGLADNKGIFERFRQEGTLASYLRHENIVTVFDVGEHDESLLITMELLKGQTLRQEINSRKARNKIFTVKESLTIISGVCEALAYAHATVIHRDIKPENIFLCDGGIVKLMDFGLAKPIKPIDGDRLTGSHAPGTPEYMAPEQAMGHHEHVDNRSDQYSVAIVLFEMLAGKRPAPGELDIIPYRPDVPAHAAAALEKALSLHRDGRFEDIQSFHTDLLGGDAEIYVKKRIERRAREVKTKKTSPVLFLAFGGLAAAAIVSFIIFQFIKPTDAGELSKKGPESRERTDPEKPKNPADIPLSAQPEAFLEQIVSNNGKSLEDRKAVITILCERLTTSAAEKRATRDHCIQILANAIGRSDVLSPFVLGKLAAGAVIDKFSPDDLKLLATALLNAASDESNKGNIRSIVNKLSPDTWDTLQKSLEAVESIETQDKFLNIILSLCAANKSLFLKFAPLGATRGNKVTRDGYVTELIRNFGNDGRSIISNALRDPSETKWQFLAMSLASMDNLDLNFAAAPLVETLATRTSCAAAAGNLLRTKLSINSVVGEILALSADRRTNGAVAQHLQSYPADRSAKDPCVPLKNTAATQDDVKEKLAFAAVEVAFLLYPKDKESNHQRSLDVIEIVIVALQSKYPSVRGIGIDKAKDILDIERKGTKAPSIEYKTWPELKSVDAARIIDQLLFIAKNDPVRDVKEKARRALLDLGLKELFESADPEKVINANANKNKPPEPEKKPPQPEAGTINIQKFYDLGWSDASGGIPDLIAAYLSNDSDGPSEFQHTFTKQVYKNGVACVAYVYFAYLGKSDDSTKAMEIRQNSETKRIDTYMERWVPKQYNTGNLHASYKMPDSSVTKYKCWEAGVQDVKGISKVPARWEKGVKERTYFISEGRHCFIYRVAIQNALQDSMDELTKSIKSTFGEMVVK